MHTPIITTPITAPLYSLSCGKPVVFCRRSPAKRHSLKNVGACKYPGISQDAEALGINRSYLWMVLEGKATSAPVLARYRALKAKQAKL